MQGVDVLTLTDATAAAVSSLHQPGAGAAQLAAATEAFDNARAHPQTHQLALRLADPSRAPEAQHVGFQLLLAALRKQPRATAAKDLHELKAWAVGLLSSDRWATSPVPGQAEVRVSQTPTYVRAKCAEFVAELARVDWPREWPGLKPALLAAVASPNAGLVALALGSLSHMGDAVAEDSKDLSTQRRREMTAALAALMEQPSEAPELVACLQMALRNHGADFHVVREALNICRSFVHVVPVQVLLQHNLDKVVKVGLELENFRTVAVSALAEWVDRVCPGKGCVPSPAAHDLARFVGLVARLAQSCRFNGDQQTYAFHKQVTELIVDLCANNAASLVYMLGTHELGELWRAMLHLLRYPSVSMQHDVLAGMSQLAKASGASAGSGSPPRPPLQEYLGTLFVHCLRLEGVLAAELDAERSAWLMRSLGPPSTAEPLTDFQAWSKLLEQSFSLDIQVGENGTDERGFHFGQLKAKVKEYLSQVCGAPSAGAVVGSGEGYGGLCQLTADLVLRALAKGWGAEFGVAAFLVENAGPAALKAVEKRPQEERDIILKPSLAFLKQVTIDSATSSCSLEYRRLAFLGTWAPFYKHFGPEVTAQVVQRLIGVVEKQTGPDVDVALQRRALDTLVSMGRCGSMNPAQLQALNAECGRLAPKLPPAARGKLVEALAAAVATCSELEPSQQADLIWGIMEQATTAFRASELTQPAATAMLATILVGAASAPGQRVTAAGSGPDEPNFLKLREVRTLIHVFCGVATKCMGVGRLGSEDGSESSSHTGKKVIARLVQAWAPGVLAITQSLLEVVAALAAAGGIGATILAMPTEPELCCMRGKNSEELKEDPLPPELEAQKVQAVRSMLWELQGAACKAVRACLACPEFWKMPEACAGLRGLALAAATVRPHLADMLLKDVFSPSTGRGGVLTAGVAGPPEAEHGQFCSTVVQPLTSSLTRLLGSWWGVPGVSPPAPALTLPVLEGPLATATVTLTRTTSLLLSEMAGAGLTQAGILDRPEHKLFLQGRAAKRTAPGPVPMEEATGGKRQRKNNRNRNRFAALAEDKEAAAEAAVAAATSGQPTGTPQVPRGVVLAIVRDPSAREMVRQALVDLLVLPEKENVQRALVGLSIWSAQVWNMVCRGEHGSKVGLAVKDKPLEAGELLHAASDALRVFSTGLIKPVVRLIVTPPDVQKGDPAAQLARAPVACSSSLASAVQQSWRAYISAGRVNGKPSPSGLVCDALQVILTVLSVLTQVFKIQCKKLELKCSLEQVYLCPALFESAQIFRSMPNTSEAEVEQVLSGFIEEYDTSSDNNKLVIRAMLHKASPAFVAEIGAA